MLGLEIPTLVPKHGKIDRIWWFDWFNHDGDLESHNATPWKSRDINNYHSLTSYSLLVSILQLLSSIYKFVPLNPDSTVTSWLLQHHSLNQWAHGMILQFSIAVSLLVFASSLSITPHSFTIQLCSDTAFSQASFSYNGFQEDCPSKVYRCKDSWQDPDREREGSCQPNEARTASSSA